MAIVIMAAGVAATRIFHVDEYGVVLLDAVGKDFRNWSISGLWELI